MQLQHDFIVAHSRHLIFYNNGLAVNRPEYPLLLGFSYCGLRRTPSPAQRSALSLRVKFGDAKAAHLTKSLYKVNSQILTGGTYWYLNHLNTTYAHVNQSFRKLQAKKRNKAR